MSDDDDGARFTASPRGQDVRRRNRILLSSIYLLLSSIFFVRIPYREPLSN